MAKLKEEQAANIADMEKQGGAAGVIANDKLKTQEEKQMAQNQAMEAKIDAADTARDKAIDAMNELAGLVSESAASAPALLRSAKESLDKKATEIEDLKAVIKKLKEEHAVYFTYYQGLDQTSKDLDAEKKITMSLQNDISDNQLTINNVEQQAAQLQAEVNVAEAAAAQAAAERDDMNQRLDSAVNESQKDMKLLEAEIDDLKAQLASANQENANLSDVSEKANEEYMSNISAARNELSEKLAAETARANAADAEVTKVNTMSQELKLRLERDNAELKAQVEAADTLRRELEDTINGRTRDGGDLQTELDKALATIDKHQINIEALETDVSDLSRNKKVVEDELSAEKTTLSNDIAQLENKVQNLEEIVDRRANEVEGLNNTITELRANLDDKTKQFSDLEVTHAGVCTERDSLQKQVGDSTDEFTKQMDDVKAQWDETRNKLENQHADKVAQLEKAMADSNEQSSTQMADLVADRKKQEEKNGVMQAEALAAQREKTKCAGFS